METGNTLPLRRTQHADRLHPLRPANFAGAGTGNDSDGTWRRDNSQMAARTFARRDGSPGEDGQLNIARLCKVAFRSANEAGSQLSRSERRLSFPARCTSVSSTEYDGPRFDFLKLRYSGLRLSSLTRRVGMIANSQRQKFHHGATSLHSPPMRRDPSPVA